MHFWGREKNIRENKTDGVTHSKKSQPKLDSCFMFVAQMNGEKLND